MDEWMCPSYFCGDFSSGLNPEQTFYPLFPALPQYQVPKPQPYSPERQRRSRTGDSHMVLSLWLVPPANPGPCWNPGVCDRVCGGHFLLAQVSFAFLSLTYFLFHLLATS